MSILSKVLVLVNLLLGVAFLAVSCVLFSQQQEWKGAHTRDVRQLNNQFEEKDKAIAQRDEIIKARIAEVTTLQGEVERKKAELGEEQNKIAGFREQVAKAEKLSADLNDTYKELAVNIKKVQSDADSARERLDTVQKALDSASKAKDLSDNEGVKLNEQIGDLKLKIDTLTKTADDQSRKQADQDKLIAAYKKIVPGGITPNSVAPPIDAKIEEVDNASGIVIISVGIEDKVEKGFTFYVYRDDSYVGQVEVDKVFASKSAARVNKEMTLNKIQAGDGATTRVGSF